MNHCKDCKHFQRGSLPSLGPYLDEGFGACDRWEIGYHDADLKPNECQVEGDEGWGMIVGPEFGCVLWEGQAK